MSEVDQLLLWMVGVHILGLACVALLLIPAMRDDPDGPPPSDSGSDDGWGNHPRKPLLPHNLPGGGLPLPDAVPARVRLRDGRRLHERLPGRDRRPVREPRRPQPVRAPAHPRPAHHR